jgi:hypothetical protein
MHYKNGREAKNGDKVVLIPQYGSPVMGILYDATAENFLLHCGCFLLDVVRNPKT